VAFSALVAEDSLPRISLVVDKGKERNVPSFTVPDLDLDNLVDYSSTVSIIPPQ
jgi:hypothetical protein